MKIALRFALIYAGINILWSLIMFVTGLNRSDLSWIAGSIILLVPFICILFAIKKYKADVGNGFIGFSDAFKLGLIICVLGGIAVSAFSIIYSAYIDPDFAEYTLNKQVEKWDESGMSEEQIEQAIEMSQRFTSPFYIFTLGVLGSLLTGAIISLIMAAIMKKPNPDGIFADSDQPS